MELADFQSWLHWSGNRERSWGCYFSESLSRREHLLAVCLVLQKERQPPPEGKMWANAFHFESKPQEHAAIVWQNGIFLHPLSWFEQEQVIFCGVTSWDSLKNWFGNRTQDLHPPLHPRVKSLQGVPSLAGKTWSVKNHFRKVKPVAVTFMRNYKLHFSSREVSSPLRFRWDLQWVITSICYCASGRRRQWEENANNLWIGFT